MNKKSPLIVLLIVFFASTLNVKAQNDDLFQYVSLLNKACPIRINDETTLNGFNYDSGFVVIRCDISKAMNKTQLSAIYGTDAFRSALLNSYLEEEGTKPLIERIVNAKVGLKVIYRSVSTLAKVVIVYLADEVEKQYERKKNRDAFVNYHVDTLKQRQPEVAQLIEKANQEDPEAMFQLALRYRRGNGVPANQIECVSWLKRAAMKNHSEAMCYLASYYENGDGGLKVDSVMAYTYYSFAAEQKDLFSMMELGEKYRNFTKVPYAQVACIKWLKQISMGDYVSKYGKDELMESVADYYLYYLYQGNEGVEKNVSLSMVYLSKSVNHGNRSIGEALNAMGECYLEGNGVVKNQDEAIKWFKKSMDKDCGLGIGNLGAIYYKEGKYAEAFVLLKKACENNAWPSPKAMHLLSACYKYGRGTAADAKLGEYWMLEAAKYKEPNAMELIKMNR